MIVKVIGGKISDEEKDAYVKYVKDKNPRDDIDSLTIEVDGEFVNLTYHKQPIPFSRIRRITGYLTKMDRANNAKRSEISDRVKHDNI
jgi:hypothetical protein